MSGPVPPALDYHVGVECAVKRRFPLDEVAPLLRAEGGLDGVRGRYCLPPGAPEPPPLAHTVSVGGVLQGQKVPAAEVARRAEALAGLRRGCRECPANLGGGGSFGCFGALPLPVTRAAEQGLMAAVERLMEGGEQAETGAEALVRFVWDNGLTGEPFQALRGLPGWFELPEAVTSRVGPFLDRHPVSSDQVLEALFASPRPGVEHAVLFGPFLARCGELAAEVDEPATAGLVRLFQAYALAGELGVDLSLAGLPT